MTLEGQCNRCGLCCTSDGYTCINLQIDTTIGAPLATRCMAYDVRFDGMPIWGRNERGEIKQGKCAKDSAEEMRVISFWLDKGCSLKRID